MYPDLMHGERYIITSFGFLPALPNVNLNIKLKLRDGLQITDQCASKGIGHERQEKTGEVPQIRG